LASFSIPPLSRLPLLICTLRVILSCTCARVGVIKDVVAERPEDFIVHDPNLIPMLESYRDAGVKTFLLTNSYWEYTAVAMNYLFHGTNVKKDNPTLFQENKWLDLFDLAIVGSCKPAFLVDPYLNLFRVNPLDGSLLNTDGVYEIEALNPNGVEKFLNKGKVFQGGNWLHLQAM
jgi:5'-nucleotidase